MQTGRCVELSDPDAVPPLFLPWSDVTGPLTSLWSADVTQVADGP